MCAASSAAGVGFTDSIRVGLGLCQLFWLFSRTSCVYRLYKVPQKKACHRISLQGKKGKASGSILSDERASASESRDTTNGKRRIILDLR